MTDKREHIINHALELFAEKGFEGTSIRDIAEKASVNVAMVNYYFGSKEKLFEAIVEQRSLTTRGQLDEIASNKSLTDIQKVEQVIDSYIERLFSNRSFYRLIYQELILNQRESLQESIINLFSPNSAIVRGIIEKGIENGSFRQVDVGLTIGTLMGTINKLLLSQRFCKNLIIQNYDSNYVPYEDPVFRKRVSDHLKQLMHAHLLAGQR